MISQKAQYYTAQQLSEAGENKIPELYQVTSHLVYSSPATLAYNSPGAEGFGVKRAGLAIPDSVMLIVSPPCCGRNTSQISNMPQYRNRFFYLEMDETDLVTGRHLKMIPDAVCAIVESLEKKPSLVMICATCVDALLGTDWDRVAKASQEMSGVRVRPCYMYALTREGRKPPMVHVRQSLYSLLEKTKRVRGHVNLLGFFAPLADDAELYTYLHKAGVSQVRELSRCESYEEFEKMADAHFNLVLNPECRAAADDLSQRLGMPYMELNRFYDTDRIHRQYSAFFKVLGKEEGALLDEERADFEETVRAAEQFHMAHPGIRISIGETLNADPFELALALAARGAAVVEVFGTVTAQSMPYITRLAQISPQTRFYCNQDPSMMFYTDGENEIDLAIGKDAAHYHPHTKSVSWNEDRQPFGYAGVRKLYARMQEALDEESSSRITEELSGQLRKETEDSEVMKASQQSASQNLLETITQNHNDTGCEEQPSCRRVKGFRRCLTPFAPDQSGAVSVLYALGGMTVIVDAGGCAGNICGFDEPRWLTGDQRGAVFSAGLRDMDAILGRDDLLVKKLEEASQTIRPEFIALVGTPVPAVIATDYQALKRMAQRKTSLELLPVPTNGMNLYDKGVEEALLVLMKTYAGSSQETGRSLPGESSGAQAGPSVGVLGFTPMDFRLPEDARALTDALHAQGCGEVLLYGAEGGLDAVKKAAGVSRNLVVSPAGMASARYLEKTFGIPYETGYPAECEELAGLELDVKKILVVHQQVRANAMRTQVRRAYETGQKNAPSVTAASWFMMLPELMEDGDVSLREEDDFTSLVKDQGYDAIVADPVLRSLVPFYKGTWIDAVHFAVSGQAPQTGNI